MTITTTPKDGTAQISLTPDEIQSLTLTSINISHYNEKVRWALDYYKVPYTEYRTLPVLHFFTMFSKRNRKGSFKPSGTPFMTPHLEVELTAGHDPKTIPLVNSSVINGFLSKLYSSTQSPNLYFEDGNAEGDNIHRQKVIELEQRLDSVLGVHVRRYLYGELLLYAPRSVFGELGSHDGYGALQRGMWRLMHPLARLALIKVFNVTPENVEESRIMLEKEFEYLSQLLLNESSLASTDDGVPLRFLVGNRFSAADLAMSALGCMVLGLGRDEGYGAWVPPAEALRPEAVAWGEKMKATPAGQHIFQCYERYRGQKVKGSSYGSSFFGWW
ncbi:hypothetical protein BGZ73_000937 [Actinomortierella ambigua]|nr:hypothetical protein BGZ73_000937 [Actinomortierella ambigua]